MEKKLYTDIAEIENFLADSAGWKLKAISLADLFEGDSWLAPRGAKMRTCGHWIQFDQIEDGAGWHLTGANFCRQRLCPVCQWRRSRMIFAHLTDVWQQIEADGYVMLHMVLTRRNVFGVELSAEIRSMFKSFTTMVKNPRLKGFKGALRFLEVTYSPYLHSYHPHLHVLVAVRPSYFKSRDYISQAEMVKIWRYAGHLDYDPVVWFARADPRAVLEVSKYCVKPFDFSTIDPAEQLEVYGTLDMVLCGRRMIQSYGVIKEVIREKKLSDKLDSDDVPDISELHQQLQRPTRKVYRFDPSRKVYEIM